MIREEAENLQKSIIDQQNQRKVIIKEKLSEMDAKITNIEMGYNILQYNRDNLGLKMGRFNFFTLSFLEWPDQQMHNEETQKILTQISEQDLKVYNDIKEYAAGPWMVLEEFEKSLKGTTQSHAMYFNKMKRYYESKIDNIKDKFLFREEALEQALLNYKLDSMQTIEGYRMAAEDIESQFTRFITWGNFIILA